jgi:hypothetical protein
MRMTIDRAQSVADEFIPMDIRQAAAARWLADLDLRERFVSQLDYVRRLQQMRLGLVPMDAMIWP